MQSKISAVAAFAFVVASSFAPVARAATTEGTALAERPLFSEKTKAVSGFAVGSLAGLLIGGRKRKDDDAER